MLDPEEPSSIAAAKEQLESLISKMASSGQLAGRLAGDSLETAG